MNDKIEELDLDNYKFIKVEHPNLTREAQLHRIHKELINNIV